MESYFAIMCLEVLSILSGISEFFIDSVHIVLAPSIMIITAEKLTFGHVSMEKTMVTYDNYGHTVTIAMWILSPPPHPPRQSKKISGSVTWGIM